MRAYARGSDGTDEPPPHINDVIEDVTDQLSVTGRPFGPCTTRLPSRELNRVVSNREEFGFQCSVYKIFGLHA